MKDFIVILILVLLIGLAVCYIVKKKKSGAKCIGCPDGCCCSKSCCQNEPDVTK